MKKKKKVICLISLGESFNGGKEDEALLGVLANDNFIPFITLSLASKLSTKLLTWTIWLNNHKKENPTKS